MVRPNKARSIGGEENLARRLERERRSRDLSYEALAKRMTQAGCSIQGSALFKIEKGTPPRRITVDELVALADVFETSIEDLLTPIEVLDQRLATELLNEMESAEVAFLETYGRVVEVWVKFLELAAKDAELSEFVHNHRLARTPSDGPGRTTSSGLPVLIDLQFAPNYDSDAFTRAVLKAYLGMLDQASDILQAMLAEGGQKNGKR